jgi:predicted glycosyltransferase
MARNKECLHELLSAHNISFINRGKGSHSLPGKYAYSIYILLLSAIHLILFRPRLTLSLSSPYLITASRFLHIPTLTYDDTDNNPRLLPFIKRADYIFTPANYPYKFHKNHFHIKTFKELAYLVPTIPGDRSKREALFFRLTRTDSIHHGSEKRINLSRVIKEINRFSLNHTTYLSSEIGLTDTLSNGVLFPDKVKIHQDLKKCRAFWGNSATMATEAVILGIPSIFIGYEKFAYLKELEDNGLLYCFSPDKMEFSFKKLYEIMQRPILQYQSEPKLFNLLREKINISGLLIWFIENLPDSAQILRDDMDMQFRFRNTFD